MSSVEHLHITEAMKEAGYIDCVQIASTLQGSIWRSSNPSTNKSVVIKVTDRYLHKNRIGRLDGETCKVQENIKKEIFILQKLSRSTRCPKSIAQYIDSFKSNQYYFMVMQDGGHRLFDFVTKAHKCIEAGKLDIDHWHKVCKLIFNQMIECIDYIHSKNVCHFDISLENFLIGDVRVDVTTDGKLYFCTDSLQIKLCDFGIAESFRNASFIINKYCGKPNYKSPEIVSRKTYSAKSNDIWCLGVCLFMVLIGSCPFKRASKSDKRFMQIMHGDIDSLLSSWNRLKYVNSNILDLFKSLFTYEEERVSMDVLKQCKWLQ